MWRQELPHWAFAIASDACGLEGSGHARKVEVLSGHAAKTIRLYISTTEIGLFGLFGQWWQEPGDHLEQAIRPLV
jgi:hypothetical protein